MFGIGIPTLNRYDLLKPTLERYASDFPGVGIFIVDNGRQGIESRNGVRIIRPNRNIGVAASWNLMCELIFRRHPVAIMLNDDVYWGQTKGAVIEELMTSGEGFIASERGWCNFAIRRETWKKVGKFDERFYPAYYEDNDYGYRMLYLHGVSYKISPLFTPIEYRVSQTIEKDPSVNKNFERNKRYYIRKWGGEPGQEKFNTPFNE